ncbi:MAG: hypothetical protein KF812_12765, partial [Fimbriimonadaceae bacterium]|nr:hypothetical protein [Fimbriimonadaceae bacterium]
GGTVPDPEAAATFYAGLFATEAGRLLDNSHVVDSGEIRLRFRRGETEPMLWLSQDVPDEYLDEFGFKPTKSGYWLDPFGFQWARPVQVGPVQAAVEFPSS